MRHSSVVSRYRSATYLKQTIGRPHPCREALKCDVKRRHTIAPKQFIFSDAEDGQRDAEEHIRPIDEKNVPHTKQRLSGLQTVEIPVGEKSVPPRANNP
jgi:hypothetical protein